MRPYKKHQPWSSREDEIIRAAKATGVQNKIIAREILPNRTLTEITRYCYNNGIKKSNLGNRKSVWVSLNPGTYDKLLVKATTERVTLSALVRHILEEVLK